MQLAPRSIAGVTMGAEVAQPHPAPIGTGGMRAEVQRGVHLAPAVTRGDQAGWRTTGALGRLFLGVLTGNTQRRVSETHKGFGLSGTFLVCPGGCGWVLPPYRTIVWPGIMQHGAEPQESQQHQLVEKRGDTMAKPPHTVVK